MRKYSLSYLLIFIFIFSEINFSQQLAFPSAEGYGRFTTGGRGGRVIEVTNLNDDNNPGSFRYAVTQSYPRIVVFKVSGTIHLTNYLKIKYGNLTIAGQTAPGDGICIADYTTELQANNVIVRYIRFRLGDVYQIADDSFWGRDLNNIILDHCSFTWAIDENGSWYDNSNFTMQWCLNGESLYHSYHPKGNHGYGGIWGGMGATFHHNLLADNSSRNPRFNGARYNSTYLTEKADYRNNVIFNWGFNSAYGGESGNYNMINNYYKPGPATSSGDKQYRIVNPSDAYGTAHYSKWYIDGNYVEGNPTVSADNWNGGVQPEAAPLDSIRLNSPLDVAPVTTESALDAYNSVLADVGDNFPKRDSVDLRIINEVKTGNAPYGATYNGGNKGIIDSQTDVGGWPQLVSTTPSLDTDHDGMPDDWESQFGLNPNDSTDSHIYASDGYTMIEEYINGLVSSNATDVELSRNNIPDKFSISQNYPNPFNPSTVISFVIPEAGSVEITIYSSIGQKVRELLNQNLERGSHSIQWNGKDFNNRAMASGVYIGVVKYRNSLRSIKMLLMK